MVLIGYIAVCESCKERSYRSGSKAWVCSNCGAAEKDVEIGDSPTIFVKDDEWIDNIPSRMEGDSRRETYKDVERTRSKIATDGHPDENSRLTMRIPPAIYHARLKDDRHYWKDPANSKRHKNWKV
jgi:hypothetical protein